MARRPTIVDVARRAGVSKSTVSLVLQNSPLVRPATRDGVRAAMEAIDYVYNRSAAQMRGGSAGLIGLVINDLRNPFFTEFATSAQMTFAARGYACVIANTDEDGALQTQVVGSMIEHGVAAFLISPAYDADAFRAIERAALPAMQVLRRVDPRGELFPFWAPDYAEGGRAATRHLIDRGARRIAFVGGVAERGVTRERMEGYAATLTEAGLEPTTLPGRPTRAFGLSALEAIRGRGDPIDAVLCFNDLVALGLHAGCARSGIDPGRDLAIIGFDDIEDCALVHPQLSSVRCAIARLGQEAATAMLSWLEDGAGPPADRRSPVELIVRASSG